MRKCYLVIQKGPMEKRVFAVETELTIGRNPSNAVHLSDPAVSREHAKVYRSEGRVILEDLDSHNGTAVNGKRIGKTILSSGDIVRIGKVAIRFLEEELSAEETHLVSTEDILQSEVHVSPEDGEIEKRSHKLIEAFSQAPLLREINEEDLANLALAMNLIVFDRGREVVRVGDRGQSLFVILDGRVQRFTYDHQGKPFLLDILSTNQCFGEVTPWSGRPHGATIQTLEETLLGEIGHDALEKILQRSPSVKSIMEDYLRENHKILSAAMQAAGLTERRAHPRFNERLAVSFTVSPPSQMPEHFPKDAFLSISENISSHGVRLQVEDRSVLGLPLDCQLLLELALSRPRGTTRCSGRLKYIIQGREGLGSLFLGIAFSPAAPAVRKKLQGFFLR